MKKIAEFIVDKKYIIFILTIILLAISVYGIFKVNVNYDMSSYLPDDSNVKKGMEVMSEEFGDMSSITVMFDDLTEDERLKRKSELEQIENVKNVTYLQDDENYQKGNHSKYLINVSANTYSNDALEVLNTIKDKYGDSCYLSGAVVDNDMMVSTLMEQIPIIAIIAVIIIFIILFILCDTWIEPFLYMTCIGIAVLINMGTNAMLSSVSFMTFAVGALLQMGLSMDYSIMLMNRYNQEKEKNNNPSEAMKEALANSFGAIAGSSVTTIVGLLALLFMSFKIGADMGVVLAKGVFISLLCIFIILPGLVVQFNKLMEKTRKKSLYINTDPIMKLVRKTRFIIVPIIIVLVFCAYLRNDDLSISYVKAFDNEEQEYIESAFGVDNQMVLLYNHSENKEIVEQAIKYLEELDNINYVQDYWNTIGKEYTYSELSKDMGISVEQAKMMYQMFSDKDNLEPYENITLYDLIVFLDDNIVSNPAYSEFMTDEQKQQIKDSRKELENGKKQIVDAEKELANGEREIVTNEKKLLNGEKELKAVAKQLEDGQKQLKESEKQIIDSEKKISEVENKLAESEKQILSGKEQIAIAETQLEEKEKELEEGEKQILSAEKQLEQAKNQMIEEGVTEAVAEKQLAEQKAEIQAQKAKIQAGKEQIKEGKKELASKKTEIQAGRKQLEEGKTELASGREQLESGKVQLEKGKQELEYGREQYQAGKKETENGKKQLADGKKKIKDGKKQLEESKQIYQKAMNVNELSEKMETDAEEIETMLKMKRMSKIDVEDLKITLEEFLNFVYSDILNNTTYSSTITDDMRKDLEDGKKQIDENKELLLNDNYNRMIISFKLPVEGEETFEFIKSTNEELSNKFNNNCYLIGDAVMGYEMDKGFSNELNFVTLLTIVAILIVVVFTLKSIFSSVMLVAVIQGAVYMTTAISVLQGTSVNYIALILVQCILMGATIDYGILFICNYVEIRKNEEKKKAMCISMKNSIKTILTSSLILIGTCLSVGFIMTQKIISQTCMIVACGAAISVIMVILVLPALTVTFDRFIVSKSVKK